MTDQVVYPNECCNDLSNHEIGFGPRGGFTAGDQIDDYDVTITHCTVCECRHVAATVDPMVMGLTGSPVS